MHHIIRRIRRVALATAVASLAATGVAQACTTAPVSQPFKAFGDSTYYALASGGAFEPGAPAWTLNANTKVLGNGPVAGNEPFFLNSTSDATALRIKASGQVVSPAFCVDGTMPTLRFLARTLNASSGFLKVELLYADPAGNFKPVPAGTLTSSGYGGWKPTPSLKLYTALPMAVSQGTTVKLRLTADKAGDWLADDIYVDPRMY
jgi:hypothetical protein